MQKEENLSRGKVEKFSCGFHGISGSTLKLIAIFTMLTDHIGATVVELMMEQRGISLIAHSGIGMILRLSGEERTLALIWWIMRMVIGRIAFPIFCYLLVEGFLHTRSVKKYAVRLGVFALLSEIPFDLGLFQSFFHWKHQNVMFTLLAGLLCMELWELVQKHITQKLPAMILDVLALAVFCVAAELLRTDYGACGVLLIMILYGFRNKKPLQMLCGAFGGMFFLRELTAPLAFPFIAAYNRQRGLKLKYFFYAFYPLHLLLLYLLCVLLGLAKTA